MVGGGSPAPCVLKKHPEATPKATAACDQRDTIPWTNCPGRRWTGPLFSGNIRPGKGDTEELLIFANMLADYFFVLPARIPQPPKPRKRKPSRKTAYIH